MVKTKKYFLNPIIRQNFANTFAVTHNLNLELCHKTLALIKQEKLSIEDGFGYCCFIMLNHH